LVVDSDCGVESDDGRSCGIFRPRVGVAVFTFHAAKFNGNLLVVLIAVIDVWFEAEGEKLRVLRGKERDARHELDFISVGSCLIEKCSAVIKRQVVDVGNRHVEKPVLLPSCYFFDVCYYRESIPIYIGISDGEKVVNFTAQPNC
jgi:hypothetical protein